MRKTTLLCLMLAGCTTGPAIAPMASAPDVFVIERESPSQYPPPTQLVEQTRAEASDHCAKQGGEVQVIDAQPSKGWNMTGNVPVYKMRFRCTPLPAAQEASGTPR
jgi:hypothetical protein